MGMVKRSAVQNILEVPGNAILEMAGLGLTTQNDGQGPPKLTVNLGEGLELTDGGQVGIALNQSRQPHRRDRIRVLANIHQSMDGHTLVTEKVFVVYEKIRTFFGLMVDLEEVERYSVLDRTELPRGGYVAMLETSSRKSTMAEPNFYKREEREEKEKAKD